DAAVASARPWLPADAVTRVGSAPMRSDKARTAFNAPLNLKDLVCCSVSSFSQTVRPVMALRACASMSGVRRTCPASRRDAATTSARVSDMIIESYAVPRFAKNAYVLCCERTRDGVVIDPGDEVEEVVYAVAAHGLAVQYILLTHSHLDHI